VRGLTDKVAIVTGGGQGIGRALSLRLAQEGCKVAIFDLKLEAGKETERLAGDAVVKTYEVDVGDYGAVKSAVESVESELGPIWALVNNAGWDRPTPFLATDQALWDKIIRINLYGPLNTHHVVAPLMAGRRAGRIINIASDAARVGTSNEAVYSACKGGLISFTKSIARELASKGVLLNAVCPGPTNTPMMAAVLGEGEQAVKWKDAMVRGIPLKRMGEPEDYAGIVAFLAEVARPSQIGINPFLRGFFFTGMRAHLVEDVLDVGPAQPQVSAPIDAGATRIFSLAEMQAPQAPVPQSRRGGTRKVPQWVFLPHLFSKILLADKSALEASRSSVRTSYLKRTLLAVSCAIVLIFLAGELVLSRIAYHLKLRDHPY